MSIVRRCLWLVFLVAMSQTASGDLIGHGGMVRSVDVSPDGKTVLTGSFDYTARLWDFGDQTEVAVLEGHDGPVTSVRFSPDGRLAVTTSDDFTAILWDVQARRMLHRLNGHKHKVMTAAFSKDGRRLATGAWDKTVRIWDVATGAVVTTLEAAAPVNAVLFLNDDRWLAVGGHAPKIDLYDIASGDPVGKFEGHRMGITALRLSADGGTVLSSSIDKTMRLWDVGAQKEVKEIDVRNNQVYDVSFSPDGKYALTAGKDGYVVEWDLAEGKPVHEVHAHEKIVWSVAYAPDGRFAVSASSDEQARVWHLETGDRIGLTADISAEPQPWLDSEHPGAKLYTKCARCHALTAAGPKRSGPHFEGLFGRAAGSVPDYRYSDVLKHADFTWNEKTLFELFDIGPDKMLPGTKMPVQRVPNDAQLTELVDYLRVLTKGSPQ